MTLLYREEHTGCLHYATPETSAFRLLRLKEESAFPDMDRSGNMILYAHEGSAVISVGSFRDRIVRKGDMVCIPAHVDFRGKAAETSSFLLIQYPPPFTKAARKFL